MAAFFYGYVVTQLPGGYLADRFGPCLVLGACCTLSGILTFVTPFIAHLGPMALIGSRVVVGLVQVRLLLVLSPWLANLVLGVFVHL